MSRRDFAVAVTLAVLGVAAGLVMMAWSMLNQTASHGLLVGLFWGGIMIMVVCLVVLAVVIRSRPGKRRVIPMSDGHNYTITGGIISGNIFGNVTNNPPEPAPAIHVVGHTISGSDGNYRHELDCEVVSKLAIGKVRFAPGDQHVKHIGLSYRGKRGVTLSGVEIDGATLAFTPDRTFTLAIGSDVKEIPNLAVTRA